MTRTALWRLLFILLSPSLAHLADMCHRGWRLYTPWKGPDVCVPCQQGQFMPVERHTHRKCFPCTKIENPQLEMVVSPCNTTHDTEIHCKDGYYRTQPSYPEDRGHCQRCTECKFPKRSCQIFHDTVCCSGDDYGVYINKDGHPECVRECGPGQFFDVVSDQCLTCPNKSYIEENRHTNNYCRDCEVPKSKNEIIVHPCNATHPTILGCADGYYRQSDIKTGSDHGECIKLCQKGQYLDLERETCQKCRENTYMDEDMHRFTKCNKCDLHKSVNERIIQPCNRTHSAVIGCVEGFYRQLSDDLSTSTCVQCRNCSENKDDNLYQGRACGLSHDTVCCPEPDMDVVNTFHGPECVIFHSLSTAHCGEGEYLSTDARTLTQTCLPCPQATYMDAPRHTNSSCISCKEFPHKNFCHAGRDATGMLNGIELFLIGGILEFVVTAVVLVVTLFFTWHRWFRKWNRQVADDCETVPLLGHFPAAQPGHWTMLVDYITSSSANQQLKSKQFIPLPDFNFTYLPVPYTSNEMVDLIKLQAQITVLVHVNGTSPQRPKYFPDTDKPYLYWGDKYKDVLHTGSGWVHDIRMYKDQPCLCETCRQSMQTEKSWGEVVICTAAKVVFGITEGKKCQCYFFYDTDGTDLRSCPSLSCALKVLSDTARDWCYMTFATHDEKLLKQIDDIFTKYYALRPEVHAKYKLESEDQIQPNISDSMIQKLQEKYGRCQNYLSIIKKRDSSNGPLPYQSLLSLSPLLSLASGDTNDEYLLDHVLSKLDACCRHARNNVKALQNEVQDLRKKRIRYKQLDERADEIERFLQRSLSGINSSQNIEAKDIYRPRVDPTRNLTVIVSHPLGRSKQISVGYATGLEVSDHYARYRYTNALVGGCEGARVFIIGRTRMTDHGHSSRQGWSGSWSDLVPSVADLFVAKDY